MIRFRAVNGIVWVILAMVLQVWPGVVKPAHGQGSRKDDIVFNSRGVPLAGASVHVCAMPATGMPCSPTAAIYSDPLLTQAMANPTTTDGMGNYYFYAAPGQYEIEISGPGITTKQIPNVILPSDPSAPTFNSLSTSGGISAFTLNLSGSLTVNGNTSVVGNLASGTLNLTNQSTPPGAASAGTVNLYTKTADKRLYYKDETGTEVGPLATASGAQTNQTNNWTATQNFSADVHQKGPNPWYDITLFGGYIGPNYKTATTCSISANSTSATCASGYDWSNGNGILIWGAGPATNLATPQAPTVTALWQAGSTAYSYCVASVDYFGGMTPCGAPTSITNGPANMGLNNYTISGQTSTHDGHIRTVTLSTAHNIPTTPYHISQYPQVEFTGGNCNGDYTLTGVPSATTVTYSAGGSGDIINCNSGTMTVRSETEVKWAAAQTQAINGYTCNGGGTSATITVPNLSNVPNAFASGFFIISGASDGIYNGTYGMTGKTATTLTFNISCNSVSDTGTFGGSVKYEWGHGIKESLIYRCQNTAANCALPANAGNYTLVGVAQGDDTYFVDKGFGATAAAVDLGQYPQTAPTSAVNEYLDTTIAAGGGTNTLMLAAGATNGVTNANTWHDNVPNIYQACAAMPVGIGNSSNGGTIYIPVPTGGTYTSGTFPIMASLQGPWNCQSWAQLRVAAPFWMQGTVEWGGNITGVAGGHNCFSVFYNSSGSELTCFQGYAYPLFHFEPYFNNNQRFRDMEIQPVQNYQVGLLWDMPPDAGGTTGFWLHDVHVDGANASNPVVLKGGFGWFWKNGGWTGGMTDYAGGRGLYVTVGVCAQTPYDNTAFQLPYIFHTEETYNFGVSEFDDCGTNAPLAGDFIFKYPLSEGLRGPAFKFDSTNGVNDFIAEDVASADISGPGGPLFDMTNTRGGLHIIDPLCNGGALVEINPTSTYMFDIEDVAGKYCPGLGIDPAYAPNAKYNWRAMNSGGNLLGNFTTQIQGGGKVAAGQLNNPSVAPSVSVSSTCPAPNGYPGNGSSGTYTYAVAAWDAVGGQTMVSPVSGNATVNGTSQCVYITQPALPQGSVYWTAYAMTGPSATGAVPDRVNGTYCGSAGTTCSPVRYTTIIDETVYKAGSNPIVNTTSLQALFQNGFYGNVTAATEATEGQCFSSSAPAMCGGFIDGFVTIAAGASSVVVNTTAVTGNSEISLTFDMTQGTNLGVTCNTTPQQPYISARTAGTSFTIAVPSNFATNPGCIGFHIKN